MTPESISTLVGPILGVFLAWVLAIFQSLWSRRTDRNIIRNRIIANLLEIRFHVQSAHRKREFILIYFELVMSIAPDVFPKHESLINQLAAIVNTLLLNEAGARKPTVVQEHYQLAIKDLTGVDPLLAFQLSHHDETFEIMEKILNLEAELSKFLSPPNPAEYVTVSQAISQMQTSILIDQQATISDAIVDVARSISLFKWWTFRKYVRENAIESRDELRQEFETLLKEKMPKIAALLKPGLATSPNFTYTLCAIAVFGLQFIVIALEQTSHHPRLREYSLTDCIFSCSSRHKGSSGFEAQRATCLAACLLPLVARHV